MRTFKWDPMFDPEEEMSTTIVWIFFSFSIPEFFHQKGHSLDGCCGSETFSSGHGNDEPYKA